ncbi:hypothetical protein ACIQZG_23720 [Lysinibacillus sp. NPDC096418]|uniref:hypothetical protein n=1 Tax=Lysinibacillus sp. NPDC096418 TaxID=3364138 RepID=UPI003808C37B
MKKGNEDMQQQTQHLTNYNQISDLVIDVSIALEKARLVQQELIENYFGKWQPKEKKDDIYYAAYEFDRYGVFARIAEDNLWAIEKKLTELNETLKTCENFTKNEPSEQSSKVTTHEIESQSV